MSTNWNQLTSQQQYLTLRNMQKYGGSFANHLANAWLVADAGNSAKLAQAFPEMIERFNPVTSDFKEGV